MQKLLKRAIKISRLINDNSTSGNQFITVPQQHSTIVVTIMQIGLFEIAKYMYKYFNNTLPPDLADLFQSNFLSNKVSLKTRSKTRLYPQFCRLKTTLQALKYSGPVVWDSIPTEIGEIKSFEKFVHCFIRTAYSNKVIAYSSYTHEILVKSLPHLVVI